jgi:hypothetical protein
MTTRNPFIERGLNTGDWSIPPHLAVDDPAFIAQQLDPDAREAYLDALARAAQLRETQQQAAGGQVVAIAVTSMD